MLKLVDNIFWNDTEYMCFFLANPKFILNKRIGKRVISCAANPYVYLEKNREYPSRSGSSPTTWAASYIETTCICGIPGDCRWRLTWDHKIKVGTLCMDRYPRAGRTSQVRPTIATTNGPQTGGQRNILNSNIPLIIRDGKKSRAPRVYPKQ